MLFRATTAMGFFERALEERGIPVHVVGGRGYFAQQQVSDLRHWLSALANPLDGLAVYSVLGSPLAGLSLDAVALIGLHARRSRRDPWWAVSEPADDLLAVLPDADRRKLSAFVERFQAERRVAGQVALETLIDRAVTGTGYDRHLLSLPGGIRRMANVRKLMRMAREFEADEGRDLRGFVDALAELDALEAREGEAPLEAEALDAVRMMTIHRAKGLEFPVVCVCDLGKEGRDDEGSLRISEDGSVGLRLAGLGGAVDSERLERLKAQGKLDAEEEERRIFYVAATRAQEQLVLSGATDLEKLHEPSDLSEPMRWVWRGFCAGLPGEGATGIREDDFEGRSVRVRWTRLTPATADELLPARRPRAGRGCERRRAAPRAAGARARAAAGAARAARQPAELQRPRGVPALRLPLLPAALARAGDRGVAAAARATRGGRGHDGTPARLDRAHADRAARLPAAGRAGGRGDRRGDRAPRHRVAARGRGGPACDGRARGGLASCASGSRRRAASGPSCPSRSRSPRPGPAAAAC